MPYLIGPNSVAITPNRNSVTNMIGTECSQKPTTPSAETAISTSFTQRAMTALSKRSASWPPRPDRKKNGPMNTAAVSVTSEPAVVASYPALNRIRNTSAFFRKLSLNAEKNWHQNSGAKRRDVIRESDMVIPLGSDIACLWPRNCEFSAAFFPLPALRGEGQAEIVASFLAALDPHQQTLGARILDAVHQLSALVHVTQRLGHGDARLHQQCGAHREVGLDPDIDRREQHAEADHADGGEERRVGEGDPGCRMRAALCDLRVHDVSFLELQLGWVWFRQPARVRRFSASGARARLRRSGVCACRSLRLRAFPRCRPDWPAHRGFRRRSRSPHPRPAARAGGARSPPRRRARSHRSGRRARSRS